MIEVHHLTKRYGPFTAVDDVSFSVGSGEILGFLGPNGAGKTTTMRVITGYMPATEGAVTVAGHDVFAAPIEAKKRTGYLPETPPLYPDMTVRDYLTFVARIKGVPAREVRSRVDQVMKRTYVADMASRHCGKLSKGYRQRVGLAQAIIHNPDVLILDEPTAGLDPFMVQAFREAVLDLRRRGDTTVFLSSHSLTEVETTCDRVGIIRGGRMVLVSALADLERDAPRRVAVKFSRPVTPPVAPAFTVRTIAPDEWEAEVVGPLGPFLRELQPLPVLDLHVEPFSLERHLLRLYASPQKETAACV